VAANPDYIVLKRHRDLQGLRHYAWLRRGLIVLLGALLVVGLLNGFGQRPKTSTAETGAARLELYAPSRVRGGLYFEARFHITAVREIRDAGLVLDPGWAEGMTINTIEPSPIGEASRDGKLALDLGHIPQGQSYLLFMQLQVNPTNVGRRSQNVELFDGERHLLTIHRTVTIFP
jgi:hypothetical protein